MTKGMIVHTNGKIEHVDADMTLRYLQAVVQGHIEHVFVIEGVHLYCNEEGKLNGLPVNMTATVLAGRAGIGDDLVGEVIFLGDDGLLGDGEEKDLPPEWQAL